MSDIEQSRMRRAGLTALAAIVLAVGFVASPAAARTADPGPRSHSAAPVGGPAAIPAGKMLIRRACAPPTHRNQVACLVLIRTDVKPSRGIQHLIAPAGFGPADLRSAYALPSSGGAGQTIAIIDTYDDPNAESDLAVYRSQYGLPPCTTANGCFRKVDENGGNSLPAPDAGWAAEESLDLDMASAICPSCRILLVEAAQPYLSELGGAVNTAVRLGAKYVSNSYGGPETSDAPGFDSSYFDHPGVAITASSGDDGYRIEYPAASHFVTAVGGTSLSRASGARGWGERAWNGSGSGCAAYIAKQSWQTDGGCARRTVADVSAVADPATGVAVYDTYQSGGWQIYGGTSAAAPIIAGVYALAGPAPAQNYPASFPYQHPAALFDVASGSNGSCTPAYLCTAGAGYDGPTGLGTPNGLTAFRSGTGTSPCAAPGNKIVNGGFESGASPWTSTPNVMLANGSGETAHSGTHFAWLDGYGTTHTDTLAQTVTIPAGCRAVLNLWLHIDTAETGTVAYDTLTIKAGSRTVATYTNTDAAPGYRAVALDLSSFAGQTVSLSFTGTEDASLQTGFVVDDVALNAS
ncbi:S8 family serine peptidase [Actinoallomurus sp. NPDC050550]|uniref:S8 family serine peptidase n=1 Tax=Actinoallomurus sp. NPDC050550 TaxID=3154937 RepID=UPI003409A8E8